MAEIYDDIPLWDGSVQYELNDVVLKDGYYFYCRKNNKNCSPLENPVYWANGQDFWWSISYGTEIEYLIKVNEIEYGDSYKQSMPQGVGNVRYKPFTLNLSLLSYKEAKAISIFLSNSNNYKYFNYSLPMPHARTIRVACKNWNNKKNYDDNYSITCTFEEYWNYEYQPSFVEASNVIVPVTKVRFVAERYVDGVVNYVVAKCKAYSDVDASLYTTATNDILLPYVSNGDFRVKDKFITVVLKGARNDAVYNQTYADNLKSSLVSQGLMTSSDSIEAYVLDGKIYYLAVESTKAANVNSSDFYEKATASTNTTLQFLPFKCFYNTSDSKIWSTDWNSDKTALINYSMGNKWATMTLRDALKFWWKAYYFACMTSYGLIYSQISNHNQLNQFIIKTFTATGSTGGGTANGYCWINASGYRYQSADPLLFANNNYTEIISRSILDIKVVIFAQIYIPALVLGAASWPLSGTLTDAGTWLSGINGYGSGASEGNPIRGIQDNTASAIYTGRSCKSPNYIEYVYGFHSVNVGGYFLDTVSNWCMSIAPIARATTSSSLITALDTKLRTNNQALGNPRRNSGISVVVDTGTVNTCNSTTTFNSTDSALCAEDVSEDNTETASNSYVNFLFNLLGV